jgi:hypothetical protein
MRQGLASSSAVSAAAFSTSSTAKPKLVTISLDRPVRLQILQLGVERVTESLIQETETATTDLLHPVDHREEPGRGLHPGRASA